MISKTMHKFVWGVLGASLLFTFTACSKKEDVANLGGDKVDIAAQAEKLKSPDAAVKQDALVELSNAGPRSEKLVQEIMALLADPDPVTRRLAAYALQQIGPKAAVAVPKIKELLKDNDREAQMAAVNALRVLDPKESGDIKTMNVTGQ